MSLELCSCRCGHCVVRGHHNPHKCAGDKPVQPPKIKQPEYRYKIMITGYKNGPWSSIIEHPVTSVSFDIKSTKPFWLSKMGYAKTASDKPLLFSKSAADYIAAQIDRWDFSGPGPNGKATARIVPVEVK